MPLPEPRLHRVPAEGLELAVFEWGRARPDAASFLLAHATGFHARCWDAVVEALGERHVLAVDQRGHGRSRWDRPIEHWRVFGEDLSRVVEYLELRALVGVGHSMGGHAMVEAAARHVERFERLVLIDPVIASPGSYSEGGWATVLGGAPHPTARRRRRFASPDAMVERFADRHPFRLFEPRCLRDYCEGGLRPADDGEGFELACAPEVEASIYMTSRTNPGVYDAVRAFPRPVRILRAKEPPPDRGVMDFASSPTWPGLVTEFPDAREHHWPERSHFLPMEVPAEVARVILEG